MRRIIIRKLKLLFYLKLQMKFINLPISKRKLCFILISIVFIIILILTSNKNEKEKLLKISNGQFNWEIGNAHSRKWIVITTINNPTELFKKLKFYQDWKVCVIGDENTPSTWKSEGVVFINFDDQIKLGFKILKYLHASRYTRKLLGYLYVIQHGAEYIYDTDDDNFPIDNLKDNNFQFPDGDSWGLLHSGDGLVFNPYPHFGQLTLWPRGFPLDLINLPSDRTYRLCKMPAPAIQQGVVNSNPDVDAVLRLTRKNSKAPIDLQFDRLAPPVYLPKGSFAPFNCQNTLFNLKSLWALFLPQQFSDRETDIFRSYWAERLLWLLGERVSFEPPNVQHVRSGHIDLEDFKKELKLYTDVSAYINFINVWNCKLLKFSDCIHNLTAELVKANLWHSDDLLLLQLWLEDLADIGYTFPPVVEGAAVLNNMRLHEKNLDCMADVIYHPVEQKTSFPNIPQLQLPPMVDAKMSLLQGMIKSRCGQQAETSWLQMNGGLKQYANSILVIRLTRIYSEIVPTLEAMYRPYFDTIVYCTNQIVDQDFAFKWRLTVVRFVKEKPAMMSCIISVYRMGIGQMSSSLIYLSDVMLVPNLSILFSRSFWLATSLEDAQDEHRLKCGLDALECVDVSKVLLDTLTQRLSQINISKSCFNRLMPKSDRVSYYRIISDYPLRLSFSQIRDLLKLRRMLTDSGSPIDKNRINYNGAKRGREQIDKDGVNLVGNLNYGNNGKAPFIDNSVVNHNVVNKSGMSDKFNGKDIKGGKNNNKGFDYEAIHKFNNDNDEGDNAGAKNNVVYNIDDSIRRLNSASSTTEKSKLDVYLVSVGGNHDEAKHSDFDSKIKGTATLSIERLGIDADKDEEIELTAKPKKSLKLNKYNILGSYLKNKLGKAKGEVANDRNEKVDEDVEDDLNVVSVASMQGGIKQAGRKRRSVLKFNDGFLREGLDPYFNKYKNQGTLDFRFGENDKRSLDSSINRYNFKPKSSLRSAIYGADFRSSNISNDYGEDLSMNKTGVLRVVSPFLLIRKRRAFQDSHLEVKNKRKVRDQALNLDFLSFLLPYFLPCDGAEFLNRVGVVNSKMGVRDYVYPVNLVGQSSNMKWIFCEMFLKDDLSINIS